MKKSFIFFKIWFVYIQRVAQVITKSDAEDITDRQIDRQIDRKIDRQISSTGPTVDFWSPVLGINI